MEHISQVHTSVGETLKTARPDFQLFQHLWQERLISDSDLNELKGGNHKLTRMPTILGSSSVSLPRSLNGSLNENAIFKMSKQRSQNSESNYECSVMKDAEQKLDHADVAHDAWRLRHRPPVSSSWLVCSHRVPSSGPMPARCSESWGSCCRCAPTGVLAMTVTDRTRTGTSSCS